MRDSFMQSADYMSTPSKFYSLYECLNSTNNSFLVQRYLVRSPATLCGQSSSDVACGNDPIS